MKHFINLATSLLLFCCLATAQHPGFTLSIDKQFYTSVESVKVTLAVPSSACSVSKSPFYLQILNSRLELIHQFVIKAGSGDIKTTIPLAGIDTGYYLLQAYSNGGEKYSVVQQVAFGVNIPAETQVKEPPLQLFLYPESGQALLNHTTKFALHLQTATGIPVADKILVQNKSGQLIAVANTQANGWEYMDIPVLANDELSFTNSHGKRLLVVNNNISPLIANTGFTIMAQPAEGQIQVEIRKAEGEAERRAVLEVFYNELLLHDATAIFNGDTTIVGTQFSTAGLENKLLRLILKDASGTVITERAVMMPAVHTDRAAAAVHSEIDCRANGPVYSGSYSYLPAVLNNQLIPFVLKQAATEQAPMGFSLYFQNKQYAGKTIDYAILQGDANLLQGGEITADPDGVYRIDNCEFLGEAVIQFYENNRQVMPFTKAMFPQPGEVNGDVTMALLKDLKGSTVTKDFSEAGAKNEMDSTGKSVRAKELSEVSIVATKSRMVELDDKYVSNGLFKDFTARQVNVEDDEMAVTYSMTSYLIKSFPGLTHKMNYRQGYIDFYLDEQIADLATIGSLHLRDVGYIKFFTTPVRGGMAAQRGGALLRGDSYAAGLQGSIAVYTKKYSEQKVSNIKGLIIRGYQQE